MLFMLPKGLINTLELCLSTLILLLIHVRLEVGDVESSVTLKGMVMVHYAVVIPPFHGTCFTAQVCTWGCLQTALESSAEKWKDLSYFFSLPLALRRTCKWKNTTYTPHDLLQSSRKNKRKKREQIQERITKELSGLGAANKLKDWNLT